MLSGRARIRIHVDLVPEANFQPLWLSTQRNFTIPPEEFSLNSEQTYLFTLWVTVAE